MSSSGKEETGPPPTPLPVPGSGHPPTPAGPKFKAYKLLLDPCLVKGATKLYRFDGVVPDDPTYPPVVCRDPRTTLSLSRSWNRQEGLELPIPRFKIDRDYVGIPPPIEVSITNLNDNVDRIFLFELLQKFGRVEDVQIFYHPLTNKHLGIAKILFENKVASKACVAKLNQSPLMGNILNVFFDPFGVNVKKLFEELIQEKKVEPPTPKKEEKKVNEVESKNHGHTKPQKLPTPTKSSMPPQPPPAPPIHIPTSSLPTPNSTSISTPLPVPPPTTLTTPLPIQTNSIALSNNVVTFSMPQQSVQFVSLNLQKPIHQTPPPYNAFPGHNFDVTPVTTSVPPPPLPIPIPVVETITVAKIEIETVLEEPVKPLLISSDLQSQPVQSVTVNEELELEDGEDEVRSPKMDLDTRIKLLLKSSKSTPFGKFLNFNMSDSDEDESDPRGRFRGGFTIRKRKSLCISRSEIWQSENSDLEVSSPPRPKTRRRSSDSPPPSPFLESRKPGEWKPVNGLVQQFRLSDLDQVSEDSEIELPSDKRETVDVRIEPTNSIVPGDSYQPMFQPPPGAPCYDPEMLNQYYQANTNDYMQQMSSYMYSAGYPVYPVPPPPPWDGTGQPQQYDYSQINYSTTTDVSSYYNQMQPYELPPPPPPEVPVMSPKTELRASAMEISMSVLRELTTEVRQILHRDCEKRLIEGMSFKQFEEWCNEQMKLYKEMKEQRDREKKKAAEEKMNGKLEMTITEDALTGFGFRSASKLPSFKIHKKVVIPPVVPVKEEPVPVLPEEPNDADSDIDIEHKRRPVRRLTLSSDSGSELGYSSDDGRPNVSSPKSKKAKIQKVSDSKRKSFQDLWAESSISEQSTSPKQLSQKEEVVVDEKEREEAEKKKLQDELLARKRAAFEQALQSPPRPTSPERVSMEGPYVHTYDHNYSLSPLKHFPPVPELKPIVNVPVIPVIQPILEPVKSVPKPRAARGRAKPEPILPPPKPVITKVSFKQRDTEEEREIMLDFLWTGVDAEDILYFKQCFETMLKDPAQAWMIKRTHWTDHPPTKLLERKRKSKRRVHVTGCARTEGFYHLDEDEKRRHKMQWAKVMTVEYSAPGTAGAVGVTALAHEKHQGKTQIEKSREARSQQRRILTALGNEVTSTSDLLKFNQLKFRKKNLCFRRSTIHDWGLFAAEPIAADEMVIEYVGQTIRPYLADVREQKYEKQGIGSSYLFRIDLENIIDATKCGNLSRFINHSCNPNCYAKVITIQGEKKIVIYSKEAIAVNEEITYDYKFPIEEKKIICLCGTPQCRGTLN